MTSQLKTETPGGADWWRGAVIYQIYPRSFQDSNNDGIGDLAGIAMRLEHVANLGADAVWISPFFTSPMKDFGYDVSDYCAVDPMFGSLSDFDALIARAHELGLRVMIDLVLSHTSDLHPWFLESRTDRENAKADWYVWADAKPDGTPPNNWLSIFGGSSWQWNSSRQQYYLHNFLTSQPDLNFHCTDVQEALLDVARFWLERGVDGFRLDTINFYTHDAALTDNPALPPERREAKTAPAVNPYTWQDHLHDKSQPENLTFLRRLRAVMEPYGAAAVGEVGDDQRGLEILGQYTAGNDLIHMCYAFELLSGDAPQGDYVKQVMEDVMQAAPDGWACWAYSNHDVVRHATRWHLTPDGLRAYSTLLMCLRGSACIYQGEELGLPEAEVGYDDLQDPYGIEFWPEFKGRDGCRTPMVWEAGAPHAGFGYGKPWLPVSPLQAAMAVDTQSDEPNSLMTHYQRVIALRKAHPVLRTGTMEDLEAEGPLLHFLRRDGAEEIFCAFNLGTKTASVPLPAGEWSNIGKGLLGSAKRAQGLDSVTLPGWGFVILKREE
ncbi:DUF3459 domain-containing protein [Pseudooceanicola sp. CBS1P-1]|uniref:DUF3459 domain-containing protein n=1 Tax=Pseudooceanicola albus TaxID=2692189 RepID=A0A6L7G1Q8_9RHOB|nr:MULTISPECIES: alpha-glucosidase [Pseudooceanicola]MBT9385011.1 DUF3459 domain-containing protein [Pseudooceanicola endophyticus]MXN17995.1 DUF3459 domain-containing protein [Pseudooceanicola albus]